MKIVSTMVLSMMVVMGSFSALAQETSREAMYTECIDKVIDKYACKAKNMESDRKAVRRDAAVATLKAAYFKSHKNRLVNEMCAQNMEPKRAKIDYFLTKSFGDFMGQNLDQAVAELLDTDSGKSQKDIFEAYSQEKE